MYKYTYIYIIIYIYIFVIGVISLSPFSPHPGTLHPSQLPSPSQEEQLPEASRGRRASDPTERAGPPERVGCWKPQGWEALLVGSSSFMRCLYVIHMLYEVFISVLFFLFYIYINVYL